MEKCYRASCLQPTLFTNPDEYRIYENIVKVTIPFLTLFYTILYCDVFQSDIGHY